MGRIGNWSIFASPLTEDINVEPIDQGPEIPPAITQEEFDTVASQIRCKSRGTRAPGW
jgi:hypothetical protein